jgi:hypothetical protein
MRLSQSLSIGSLFVLALVPLAWAGGVDSPEGERAVEILFENFEDAWPPPNWHLLATESEHPWERSTFKAHSGEASAVVNYGPPDLLVESWLITPALDVTDRGRIFLEFHEDQQYWSAYGGTHAVLMSVTSQTEPDSFKVLAQWTPAVHDIPGFGGSATFVDLTGVTDSTLAYLAFRYEGTWADSWFLDDIHVYSPGQRTVAVLDVSPDGEQFSGGDVIAPQVTVSNHGNREEDFLVILEIEESGTPVFHEELADTLLAGEIAILDFPLFQLTAGHYYTLKAEAKMPADQYPADNHLHARVNTYDQPRKPLVHFHTNSGSNPCLPAEAVLDDFMTLHGDDCVLLRVHTWWPGEDAIHDANPAQTDSLIDEYGEDFLPHLWVDAIVDPRSRTEDYAAAILDRRLIFSPLSLHLAWDEIAERAEIWVNRPGPLPPEGDYRLRLALGEDAVDHLGANGYSPHDQAFRAMFPDLTGFDLSDHAGVEAFAADCPLDPAWDPEQLRLNVWVQDLSTGEVLQAESGFLAPLRPLLSFAPRVGVIDVADSLRLSLPLILRPGESAVASMQVRVEFDSSAVRLDSITAGSWFSSSGLPYSFTDHTPTPPDLAEAIHFSAELLGGAFGGRDTVAICHFSADTPAETTLDFSILDIGDGSAALDFQHSRGDSIHVIDSTTGLPDPTSPAAPRLLPCRPNPFNPSTRIRFELPERANIELAVYDVAGRRLKTLAAGFHQAGGHELDWNGKDERGNPLPSGLYLARLAGGGGGAPRSIKLVLLR